MVEIKREITTEYWSRLQIGKIIKGTDIPFIGPDAKPESTNIRTGRIPGDISQISQIRLIFHPLWDKTSIERIVYNAEVKLSAGQSPIIQFRSLDEYAPHVWTVDLEYYVSDRVTVSVLLTVHDDLRLISSLPLDMILRVSRPETFVF